MMNKLKKVVSLLVCLMIVMSMALSCFADGININDLDIGSYKKMLLKAPTPNGGYDMTYIPGHIRIKVNVIDWDTGEKIPGVEVGINRIGTCPGGSVNSIITLTSDLDGSAYIDKTYTVGTKEGKTVVYLDGIQDDKHIIYDMRTAYSGQSGIRFDMGPLSSSCHLDTTVSGKIRNCISGNHGGKVELYAGTSLYNDFIFHSGMPANGASIEFDLYVKTDKVTVSYENKNIKDWNPADYPSQTEKAGTVFTAPAKIPVNSQEAKIEFLGWADKETGEIFDFTKPVTSSVVLVPKWGPNPNAKGYIHLDSFLWDHDDYDGTYKSGQTNTTVNDLTYVVEYYDQANAVQSEWHTLTTVTVNEKGKADFVLTPAMLQELSDFYDSIKDKPLVNGEQHRVAIDIGPSSSDRGWHEENRRPLQYAWDWVQYNYEWFHGAGLTGVRMMWVNDDTDPTYDLDRDNNHWRIGKDGDKSTPRVGNVQYASNVNHVPWLTQEMLDDGFEIYWKCYVAPSMTVNFDRDGGTGTGDYREQMMRPINSLPEDRSAFLVKHPGGTVTKQGKVFVGWYKVNEDGSLETMPWDFANRIVTESMVLKAVYTDNLYKVRFETPENGKQEKQHKVGDTPAWVGANPTKASANGYSYEFTGWKETTGSHVNTEYTFHEDYDFDHQSRTIYGAGKTIPVTVDGTADLTVYTAQFKAIPIKYTLSYDLNGGTGSFPNQEYTVESGVTIHNDEPVKTGYRFTGWALKSTDGNWESKAYSKNETVNGKYGNTTLIAQYAPLYNYKLNFDKNTTDTVTGMPENIPETGWIEDATKTMSWTSEPTRQGYSFLGWAISANGEVVVPAGTKSYTMTGTAAALKEETLYAVYARATTDLKITKNGLKDADSAIFTAKVTTADGEQNISFTLTSKNDAVTIKDVVIGSEYTVKEESEWSWRYTASPSVKNGTVDAEASKNVVAFTNSYSNNQWLGDEANVQNVFS